jgi:hypothetical protein
MKLKQGELPEIIAKPATQEVQDLISARKIAYMIGVAAEPELADFINAGAKTADEIAKAEGLHATSLYWLLRGLASYRIFGSRCTRARAASRANRPKFSLFTEGFEGKKKLCLYLHRSEQTANASDCL